MSENVYEFDVGTSNHRPVRPDEHVSRVTVLAETYPEAICVASAMCCRPGVEMVTSVRICI